MRVLDGIVIFIASFLIVILLPAAKYELRMQVVNKTLDDKECSIYKLCKSKSEGIKK